MTAFQSNLPAKKEQDMELETSDQKPLRIGLIILLVTFGIFGGWALLAPLDSAVHAQGVVTVKGNRKTVQHLEGGIVADILVSDGELVEAGQPLILLDATQSRAELGVLRGQYYTARALESRLIAERDDLESIAFATDLPTEDLRAVEARLNEEQIFKARRDTRLGEIDVLNQRIEQLNSQIQGLKALVASKEELTTSYREEIEDLEALLSEGFVDKMRLREIQRSLSRTQGEIAEHRAAIAQSEMRIGEARLEILQLNQRFKTEVVDDLAETQARVFDISERITAIQDRVERTVIRAPVDGVVLGLSTHTIGGVIQPGRPLLDIVPEDQELQVDARVSPMDIDRIEVGTEANIRFSAFKTTTTHTAQGVVVRVSADRLTDEHTGEPYFQAKVDVTEEGMQNLRGLTLLPGMPAEVLIKTGERTLFQYLVQPARNAFARSLIEE